MLDRKALKDSATVDLGFKNTAKLFLASFFPTTPKIGIGEIRSISSAVLILVSNTSIAIITKRGKIIPINNAIM